MVDLGVGEESPPGVSVAGSHAMVMGVVNCVVYVS